MKNKAGFFIFSFIVWAVCSFAQDQRIEGIILDKESKKPVINATVSYERIKVETDNYGKFAIHVPVRNSDTLLISGINHFDKMILLKKGQDYSAMVIQLNRKSIELPTVTVFGKKTYLQSSKELNDMFSDEINYRPPSFVDYLAQPLDLLALFGDLSSRKKKNKFKRALIENDNDAFVKSRFTAELVSNVTGLKGEELKDFMIKKAPDYRFVLEADEYELLLYIKEKFGQWKQEQ